MNVMLTPMTTTQHTDALTAIYDAFNIAGTRVLDIADLRALLDMSRTDATAALVEAHRAGMIHLEPQLYSHRVTDADTAAAIHLGGVDRHIAVLL